MIRVFVAAAVPAIRAGLRAMLEQAPDMEVVGDGPATSGLAATFPDVVVLMSDGWREELEELPAGDGRPGVLLLWDDNRAVGVLTAANLRGWGILPPEATAEQVVAGVSAAAAGLVAMPVAYHEAPAHLPLQVAAAEALEEPLTAREQQVLELLGQGLSNKLIARQLSISEHTVKFHVSSTYAKLGATNRTEAVSHAARRGLITL